MNFGYMDGKVIKMRWGYICEKYEDDIFTTGHRRGRRGRVLKRSGAYLDIHVLSPSRGSGLGQPSQVPRPTLH